MNCNSEIHDALEKIRCQGLGEQIQKNTESKKML